MGSWVGRLRGLVAFMFQTAFLMTGGVTRLADGLLFGLFATQGLEQGFDFFFALTGKQLRLLALHGFEAECFG